MSIYKRLQEHYNRLLQEVPNERLIALVLCGSQNYGLDTELSDVDTKAIILPPMEDIYLNKPLISYTITLENSNEKIEIKDFRLMIDSYKKQNINFVETLFTDYYILGKYGEFYEQLREHSEEIARYDIKQAVKSMRGQADRRMKVGLEALEPKPAAWIIQIGYFLESYLAAKSYRVSLRPPRALADLIKEIKSGRIKPESYQKIAQQYYADILRLEEEKLPKALQVPSNKEYLDNFFDCFTIQLMRSYLKENQYD